MTMFVHGLPGEPVLSCRRLADGSVGFCLSDLPNGEVGQVLVPADRVGELQRCLGTGQDAALTLNLVLNTQGAHAAIDRVQERVRELKKELASVGIDLE